MSGLLRSFWKKSEGKIGSSDENGMCSEEVSSKFMLKELAWRFKLPNFFFF